MESQLALEMAALSPAEIELISNEIKHFSFTYKFDKNEFLPMIDGGIKNRIESTLFREHLTEITKICYYLAGLIWISLIAYRQLIKKPQTSIKSTIGTCMFYGVLAFISLQICFYFVRVYYDDNKIIETKIKLVQQNPDMLNCIQN